MDIGESMQDKKCTYKNKRNNSSEKRKHYDFSVFNNYKCDGQLSFEFNQGDVKIVEGK